MACQGLKFQREEIKRVDDSLYKIFCLNNFDCDIKALIALTCRYIRKERCKVQLGKKRIDVTGVIERIRYAFGETRQKSGKDKNVGAEKSKIGENIEEWLLIVFQPPFSFVYVLNNDGFPTPPLV